MDDIGIAELPFKPFCVPTLVLLKSNQAEVAEPFGLMVPFNTAEVVVMLVAAEAVTVGGIAAIAAFAEGAKTMLKVITIKPTNINFLLMFFINFL